MKKLLNVLVLALAVAVCCAGVVLAEDAVIIDPMPLPCPNPGPIDEILPFVKGTITLTEGWNLIAIPVLPANPLPVEQFIKMVVGSVNWDEGTSNPIGVLPAIKQYWQVRSVAVYKDGRFKVYPKEGVTYNMVPGEAYFVYCEYLGPRPCYTDCYPMPEYHPTTRVMIMGKPVSASVSLDLDKGWNGAALMLKQKPYCVIDIPITKLPRIPSLTLDKSDSDISDAQFQIDEGKIVWPINIGSTLNQLSRELSEQGVKAKRIVFWNAKNQEWEQYELPRPEPMTRHIPGVWDLGVELGGVDECVLVWDRPISASEGFFLLCGENGLYIPGLTQIQNPPYPPIPQRVSRSGIIERVVRYLENGSPSINNNPPYNFVLITELITTNSDGATSVGIMEIPLKGVNKAIELRLGELADLQNGQRHFVEGVMRLVECADPRMPDRKYVDVLIVDNIDLFRL